MTLYLAYYEFYDSGSSILEFITPKVCLEGKCEVTED